MEALILWFATLSPVTQAALLCVAGGLFVLMLPVMGVLLLLCVYVIVAMASILAVVLWGAFEDLVRAGRRRAR